MILLTAYPELVNFLTIVFFIVGILIVWAAIVWSDDLSRRAGEPTLMEWWKDLWKNR